MARSAFERLTLRPPPIPGSLKRCDRPERKIVRFASLSLPGEQSDVAEQNLPEGISTGQPCKPGGGLRIAAIGGLAIPFDGLLRILGNAHPALIGKAQIIFSVAVMLVGGTAKPGYRLRVVKRHPLAFDVEQSKIHLRPRIALIGCLSNQTNSCLGSLRDPTAVPTRAFQAALAPGVALI